MQAYLIHEIYSLMEVMEHESKLSATRYDLPLNPLGLRNIEKNIVVTSSNNSINVNANPVEKLELIENSRDINTIHSCKSFQIVRTTYYLEETGNYSIKYDRTPVSLQLFLYNFLDIYKSTIDNPMVEVILKIMDNSRINSGRMDKTTKVSSYFDNISTFIRSDKGNVSPDTLKDALKSTCIQEEFIHSTLIYNKSSHSSSPEEINLLNLMRELISAGANKFKFYSDSTNTTGI